MKNLNSFVNNYNRELIHLIKNINKKNLDKIIGIIKETYQFNRTLFVCGNGGSASIANHWQCDHQEGIKKNGNLKPRVTSLSTNLEIITATSNDFSFKDIFKNNLENLYNKNDVLVCMSVSGNSKNIIEVMKFAKKNSLKTILLSGFKGGKAKKLANYNINFNSKNYGIVEDCFQITMHIIAQHFYTKN